jgi:hypothetical protein
MQNIALIGAVMLALTAVPNSAEARPGGCLKYGLGGAVAGHFAGGNRWKGAVIGCFIGVYQRRRHARGRPSRTVAQGRPSSGRDRTGNYDRNVSGGSREFNRGGYFSRNQAGF